MLQVHFTFNGIDEISVWPSKHCLNRSFVFVQIRLKSLIWCCAQYLDTKQKGHKSKHPEANRPHLWHFDYFCTKHVNAKAIISRRTKPKISGIFKHTLSEQCDPATMDQFHIFNGCNDLFRNYYIAVHYIMDWLSVIKWSRRSVKTENRKTKLIIFQWNGMRLRHHLYYLLLICE